MKLILPVLVVSGYLQADVLLKVNKDSIEYTNESRVISFKHVQSIRYEANKPGCRVYLKQYYPILLANHADCTAITSGLHNYKGSE